MCGVAAAYACELSTSQESSPSSSSRAFNEFVQEIVNVDASLSALFHVSSADKSMHSTGRKFYEVGNSRTDTEVDYFSYEKIIKRVTENALRSLSEYARLHTYAEGNSYVSDRRTLESALVKCYGGLSELSIILDKVELDIQQRTIRENNETETENKNK